MSKKTKLGISSIIIFLVVWLLVNPIGQFGLCCFGYSTFSAVPRPISDFQVSFKGQFRGIPKTHDLKLSDVQWLVDENPDVIIISTGWHGAVNVSEEIMELNGIEVIVLDSDKARKKFNELKSKGVKVSIHYHSTC